MKAALLAVTAVLGFSGPSFADLASQVGQLSEQLPPAECQVFWYIPSGDPLAARRVAAFDGLCRLFDGRVLGVVVAENGRQLRLPGGSSLTCGVVDAGGEIKQLSEGLVVYLPMEHKVLFQASAVVSVEILLQVLDRHLQADHGTRAGLERYFRSLIESVHANCTSIEFSEVCEALDPCALLHGRISLVFLPPGCTECSLKRFRAEIQEHLAKSGADNNYVVTFGDPGIVSSLDWVDPSHVLSIRDPTCVKIALLEQVSSAARLAPLVHLGSRSEGCRILALEDVVR